MDIEVLTIGTELLLGFTLDTNAQVIGQTLSAVGVRIVRRTTVDDDPRRIREALERALAQTGAVLTTGGLGPTNDDITKSVVADLLECPLEFSSAVWNQIVSRFAQFGRTPSPTNRCQAEVPRGATVLPNPRGTAPGLWMEGPPGLIILLPGVPREMAGLLRDEVVPRLKRRSGETPILSLTVRTTGIPESRLAERVAGVEEQLPPLTLAYLPSLLGVDLRVTARALPEVDARRTLERAAALLESCVGHHAYGRDQDDLAAKVLATFAQSGRTLAVAESCTGGGLGWRLTEIAGASTVFLGGVVAYHNKAKSTLLDVPPSALETHGAVSSQVAEGMAIGVKNRFDSDVGLAITGVAGPSGGSPDRPVGTVWFAVANDDGVTSQVVQLAGNRHEIRIRSSQFALHLLLDSL